MAQETNYNDNAVNVRQSILNRTFADKYVFLMNLPEPLKNVDNEYVRTYMDKGITSKAIQLSLLSADIPQVTVKGESQKFGGGNYYTSTHVRDQYDPLTITIKIDNQFNNYMLFYQWLNFIYDERECVYDANDLTGNKKPSTADYMTSMAIITLDEYNNPVARWQFSRAFISNLSKIHLDYQKPDEITADVTFMFSQMFFDKLDGATA